MLAGPITGAQAPRFEFDMLLVIRRSSKSGLELPSLTSLLQREYVAIISRVAFCALSDERANVADGIHALRQGLARLLTEATRWIMTVLRPWVWLPPYCGTAGRGGTNPIESKSLPPLLTETTRYDRSSRNSSMKSTSASPCQRGGRRFEPGLVLQHSRAPSRCYAKGLFVGNDRTVLGAAGVPSGAAGLASARAKIEKA